MVIGLSGRAGSGKDTVGKIIQYLTAEDVGADCLKRIRAGLSIDGHHNSSFENKKFAGKLKLIGSILSGVPVENFEDQEFKKQVMSIEWIQPKHYNCENYDAMDGGNCSYCSCGEKEMTYREFLQKLGTEAMRDGLHTNVWVNALFADYKYYEKYNHAYTKDGVDYGNRTLHYPDWIITDMRFPNEMEAVISREGITIRVNRDAAIKVQHSGKEDDFTIEKFDKNNPKHVALKAGEDKRLHPSETALDNSDFHYTIDNDGSFEDLMKKVEEILKIEKIPLKRWSI